jgi:UDP-N-acetylglucosamine acyltransferase
VPPYVLAAGNPLKLYGLNSVGLERRGFSSEVRGELKRAYRSLFGSDRNMSEAIAELRARGSTCEEVDRLIAFIEASERGVTI